ncbi:MAG: ATPase V [Bacteroidales bacterium]|nr:ATPase V [Bacteroidales bacterium]
MITPMTKYSFILLNGEQENLLEKLQEVGLVDITRSAKPMDTKSYEFAGELELIDGLLIAINKIELPEGTKEIPYEGEGTEDPIRTAGGILMHYSEKTNQIKSLEKEVKDLAIWGEFDNAQLSKLEEAGVPIHFHVLSLKKFNEEWKENFALVEAGRDKANVYFVVAGEDTLPGEVPVPKDDISKAKAKLLEEQKNLKELQGVILYMKQFIPDLLEYRKEVCSKLDLHLAGISAVPAAENTIVTLVGYAPAENDETVTAALDATGVFYLKEEAVVEDNPPIKLENNWFVRQFEVLTDMYGRPGYNEFDPTPYISVFFLLFFAMCMGDAGYGLVLILGGVLLRKVEGMKNLAPLVSILGVGTFVVGIVMHTFFGVDISVLPWIPAWLKSMMITGTIAGFEAQMVLALAIGVVHLCLAMVVKTVYATKNKGFLGSLGTWGWTLLIVGGVLVGTFALFFSIPAQVTKWIVIGLGIVSALGIFLFNDIKRNPLKNIGSGLWETYNTVTGLLGDVLSYLRLYALGLAGGMLGKAFNDIATMTLGDGGLGWLPFVIILVIGHALNLAMCCLGAFVHPLRLNFLEFFKNSGYDGKGRIYRPIKK